MSLQRNGTSLRAASGEQKMADQTYELNEDGAPMDYPEHEQTYSMFLLLTKWGILFNVMARVPPQA